MTNFFLYFNHIAFLLFRFFGFSGQRHDDNYVTLWTISLSNQQSLTDSDSNEKVSGSQQSVWRSDFKWIFFFSSTICLLERCFDGRRLSRRMIIAGTHPNFALFRAQQRPSDFHETPKMPPFHHVRTEKSNFQFEKSIYHRNPDGFVKMDCTAHHLRQ